MVSTYSRVGINRVQYGCSPCSWSHRENSFFPNFPCLRSRLSNWHREKQHVREMENYSIFFVENRLPSDPRNNCFPTDFSHHNNVCSTFRSLLLTRQKLSLIQSPQWHPLSDPISLSEVATTAVSRKIGVKTD